MNFGRQKLVAQNSDELSSTLRRKSQERLGDEFAEIVDTGNNRSWQGICRYK